MTKELNYTKGKWEIKEYEEGHQYNFLKHTDCYNITAEDGIECVAVMGTGWASGKAKANAQLIAKAPYYYERCQKLEEINADLYKACKAQLKWSQELGYPGSILAKEALAKVEKL